MQELYCLQSQQPDGEAGSDANKLTGDIGTIAEGEAKFEEGSVHSRSRAGCCSKFARPRSLTGMPLSELAHNLDSLLCDQINTGDENEPILRFLDAAGRSVKANFHSVLIYQEQTFYKHMYIILHLFSLVPPPWPEARNWKSNISYSRHAIENLQLRKRNTKDKVKATAAGNSSMLPAVQFPAGGVFVFEAFSEFTIESDVAGVYVKFGRTNLRKLR